MTRSRAPRARIRSDGFTLVEVLVAMVLFSFGVLAAAAGILAVVSSDTHAGEQSRAVALAAQKLEELKTLPAADIDSEPAVSVDADGVEGSGPYRRRVEVEEEAEGENTKGVTVSVEYRTSGGSTRTVELYTVVFVRS